MLIWVAKHAALLQYALYVHVSTLYTQRHCIPCLCVCVCVSEDACVITACDIDLTCDKCLCLLGASNWRQLDKQEGVIFPSRHHTHTFALQHPQPCRSSPPLQYLALPMSVLLLPWTCQCDGWDCIFSLSGLMLSAL